MNYWNRDNFEGLAALASALREHPHLAHLGDYCALRERGLRQQALCALDAFLAEAQTWSDHAARAACVVVLELHARTPSAHQFLAQPLLARFLIPTLASWAAAEPASHTALRWLGLLERDPERLARALSLAPDDVPVRRRLVDLLLGHVDFATHHLGEGRFIGDLASARHSLAEAQARIDAAPDRDPFARTRDEVAQLEALLDDWEAFCAAPDGAFPEWCARRGRDYRWPVIVYYGKKLAP